LPIFIQPQKNKGNYTKYGKSEKYNAEFRAVEKQARKEKLNIWGDPELTKKYLRLKSKWGQK
jgi:endonuclease YncB( thermonuclease family)